MLKAASFFKEERDPFYKRGQARGIEKERAKAHAEKLRSAVKMKKSGFDNAMIVDVLELPIEEVEKL